MEHGVRSPLLDSPPLYRYGLPELVYGASPAAGADFVQPMDGRFFARILSVFVRLVTDANAATRELVVEYRDQQAQRWMLNGAAITQITGLTVDYCFDVFRDVSVTASDGTALLPLSEHLLAPSMDFRIHVANIQVGDQLSRIRFTWERFYSTNQPPTDYPG